MATGVFSLRKVYIKQYENITNNNFASWPESANYGYYGGGYLPPPAASHGASSSGWEYRIFTLDYSNENISELPYNLSFISTTRQTNATAVSNNSYGYIVGGYFPPAVFPTISCTIWRLDLSNNSVSLPGKNLPTARYSLLATSSSSYGYFAGGYTPSTINTITRLDFSSETVSDPGKNLPTVLAYGDSVSNNSYGYFGGGYNPALSCTITRLDFSSETVSNPQKNLPTVRAVFATTSSSSYGYFGGGWGPPYINTIARLDFSSETTSDPGKNLPISLANSAATSSSSYGYFGNGNNSPTSYICTVTRLDFSNETVSNPGKNFPIKRRGVASFSGGTSLPGLTNKSFGYFCGGYYRNVSPTALLLVGSSKLEFSTENVQVTFGTGSWGQAGVSNNTRGYLSDGSLTARIILTDFNTSTSSVPGKYLPYSRAYSAGSSSNSYGYFAGGGFTTNYWTTYSVVNTIARLDFSNETASNPGKDLLFANAQFTSISNSNYIYFGGGYGPGSGSLITRLDFSNEIVSNPGQNLPASRRSLSSVSNNSYGYFNTGENGPFQSTPVISNELEKFDFSNENTSLLPIGGTGEWDCATVSSDFYGYFGGGVYSSLSVAYQSCVIRRLDFSTETKSNPGKNLPYRSRSNAGLSN
jgi:hypothetical protein